MDVGTCTCGMFGFTSHHSHDARWTDFLDPCICGWYKEVGAELIQKGGAGNTQKWRGAIHNEVRASIGLSNGPSVLFPDPFVPWHTGSKRQYSLCLLACFSCTVVRIEYCM